MYLLTTWMVIHFSYAPFGMHLHTTWMVIQISYAPCGMHLHSTWMVISYAPCGMYLHSTWIVIHISYAPCSMPCQICSDQNIPRFDCLTLLSCRSPGIARDGNILCVNRRTEYGMTTQTIVCSANCRAE